MENTPTERPARHRIPAIFRPRLVYRFLRDRSAPLLPKLGMVLAIAYAIVPLDLVPDALPIVGWLDDVGGLALMGAWLGRALETYARSSETTSASPPRP